MGAGTRYLVKHGGRYMDQEQLAGLRALEAERAPPPLDVATLPDKAMLDADEPLAQLYAEHKEVRAYLHVWLDRVTGEYQAEPRQGLSVEARAVAQDILRKYGRKPRQRVQGTLVEH